MRIDSNTLHSIQKTFVGLLDNLDKGLGTLAKKINFYINNTLIDNSDTNRFEKFVASAGNVYYINTQPDKLSEIVSKVFREMF